MQVVIDMTNDREKRTVLEMIRGLQGMHRVEVVKFRPRRTDRQNRMYWPAIVQPFCEFLRENGTNANDDLAHEVLKFKFLRVPVLNEATGEIIGERTRSTTELTVEEFSKYVNDCIAYLENTYGIKVHEIAK